MGRDEVGKRGQGSRQKSAQSTTYIHMNFSK